MNPLCPSVTGLSQCPEPRGTSHHCIREPSHAYATTYVHLCGCGYEWTCLSGSVDDLIQLMDPAGERR